MKPSRANTDYMGLIKHRGVEITFAEFICADVLDCPICGTDELDFWDRHSHMSNAMHTACYECPKCRRQYTWDGTGPQKGYGKHLLAATRAAKKNWNDWARAYKKRNEGK